jgi:hypothetical protein
MPSSKNCISYLAITLVGLGMIGLPVYAEFPGGAIDSFNFKDYFYSHARSGLWWQMVVIPLLVGVFFVLLAAFAPRMRRKFASDLPVLGVCVLLSGILAVFIKAYVLIAFVVSSILLIGEWVTVFRRRQSRSDV